MLTIPSSKTFSQPNYNEDLVPKFELPELLISEKGTVIKSTEQWNNIRRPELLAQFAENVYGQTPEFKYQTKTTIREIKSSDQPTKEVTISFVNEKGKVDMSVIIFLPKSEKPVPLFVGYNFYGNQSIHQNPNITITKNYVSNNTKLGVKNNQADESSRGIRASRWPVDRILERGYGLATIHYGDIDPDFDDGFKNGIHQLLDRGAAQNWPSIAAWSWGLSRAMDYFETDNQIDQNQIAVIGHSRLGKTALWAGATDQRFSLVISNDSGCGGAALSKRQYGETLQVINKTFPHWFNAKFKSYSNKEENLPIDQHMLIALMAPRPVYVASAVDDQWADPKGEFLSTYYAGAVYGLFNVGSFKSDQLPALNTPVIMGKMAYHIRSGGHDLTLYDWERYMDFADIHLKSSK